MPAPLRPPLAPARTPFQRALLSWWDANRRDLPWRATRDPWAVLVSELMLQQTQVARVVPKFQAFLAMFPTPGDCAGAPVGDVVRMWQGLGYNRRAVNLHRAAQACVAHHGGQLPATLQELLDLPGVGPYTARAVLAFAHERDVGVVDTNVARVLSRIRDARLASPGEAQAVADAHVPAGAGWSWNQALFDLGATVCVKRSPACGRCPVEAGCGWARRGRPSPDPADGSAGASRPQPPLAGSDREGRGRLVDALRRGPVAAGDEARAAGWPADPARASRIAGGLVADGLAVRAGDGSLRLP
ncbi:MAG TPA: A/G-specific adenine glycosylase [Acidimicrobiales bacterium]|nr:A/G-specific adenine glycosylase [Acidimicrobiales bacterium]